MMAFQRGMLALLLLLTAVVYRNSLDGKFVFDDTAIVSQPAMLHVHTWHDVIHFGAGWRQVLSMTYGANYLMGSLNPRGYHAVNVALHLINVMLVYLIIFEICGESDAALAGAAVFAFHPLLSGAVSYIAGRSSILCGVFYFAAVLMFLKATRAPRTGMAGLPLPAWNPMRETRTWRRWLGTKYVLLWSSAGLFLYAIYLRSIMSGTASNTVLETAGFDSVLSAGQYFRTYVAAIVGYYGQRFVLPFRLSVDPYVAPVAHWYSLQFVVAVAVILAMALMMVRASDKLVRIGIAALLVSPLTAYAFMPLADIVLEHRTYIPALGVALLVAAMYRHMEWVVPKAGKLAVGAIALAFAILTVQRNTVYADGLSFWTDAVKTSPMKVRPHFNLAAALQSSGRIDDALNEYRTALQLKPDLHAAYSNMAAMQIDGGHLDDGVATLEALTETAPNYPEGWINLSVGYMRQWRSDKAIAAASRAIELDSESAEAFYNRAEAFRQAGESALAQKDYKRAAYIRPDVEAFRKAVFP